MSNKKLINNKYVILDSPKSIKDFSKKSIDENDKDAKKENEEAKKKITQAERKANEIIENANKKAKKIVENAKDEADEYYNKKVEEIKEQYEKKYEEELKNFSNNIENKINELDNFVENTVDASNEFITSVIKEVLKKYFNEEVFSKPAWINEIMKDLKSKLYSFKTVIIRMHPETSQKYSYLFESLISETFNIKEDSSLGKNEIRVETELGVFEVSPESYVQDIIDSLEGAFDEEN